MTAGKTTDLIERAGVRRAPNWTGAQAVAQVIASQEDPVVYGMPGGHTMQIFDALYSMKDQVSTHLVRIESVATVMAEARGRLTNRPAFVMGQGAWVLGNAGIGIMEAHLGASPVVLLIDATDGGSFSHHGPYQAGFGGHGAYDLAGALRAITKETFVATDATQALQMVQLAVKHATTGEPGPVAVVFHSRSLFERIDPRSQPPAFVGWKDAATRPAPIDLDAVEAAAGLIRAAQRPVIVAGNGVRLSQAERALVSFAEATGIPVATTPAGKGVFAENNALAVGVIGSFGHETANAVVGESDLVLAVGTKLGASDTANANPKLIDLTRQRLVQIDASSLNISWTWPADVAVVGDAGSALVELQACLDGFRVSGIQRVALAREKSSYFVRTSSAAKALSGRDVIASLSTTLEDDAIVTCDAGENRLFVLREFQTKAGGNVLQPNGGGGMGYAVPAAMAAASVYPHKQVVAVCGDGGVSMVLPALLSAIELGTNITVIVLDNGVLGWVYNGQRGRSIASELHTFDFAGIVRTMGGTGQTVETLDEFERELAAALRHDGLSIVVAKTSSTDKYQDLMSDLNSDDVYAVLGEDPE